MWSFQNTPVPYSLATADGYPVKTDKSIIASCLESGLSANSPRPSSPCIILDGNAFIHDLLKLPSTFGLLAEMIFDELPKAQRVDFVTDTYNEDSIKLGAPRTSNFIPNSS